jgi:heat shock protein HtpX
VPPVGVLIGNGIGRHARGAVIAGALAFGSYWKSDAIALAVSRARPAPEEEFRRLHNLVEGLCIASGLPKPRLYVIDDPAPNAFATGAQPQARGRGGHHGLLEKLNRVELEGVLAHELSPHPQLRHLGVHVGRHLVGAVACSPTSPSG